MPRNPSLNGTPKIVTKLGSHKQAKKDQFAHGIHNVTGNGDTI